MDTPNCITGNVTPRERALLDVLNDIALETMDYGYSELPVDKHVY